jgi:hypothetical protein
VTEHPNLRKHIPCCGEEEGDRRKVKKMDSPSCSTVNRWSFIFLNTNKALI